ncbi:YbaN family protein [Devosia chinhatensis]|nr:YbaN family protein [Devosia chinhatensis]
MLRPLYLIAGLVMLVLGIVGAFLPVMPTTIFLIVAAWFFARSSPRLEAWLLAHPRFGSTLRDWREHGAISRRAKVWAGAGMAAGFSIFWIGARPNIWLWLVVAVLMLACASYVLTRPLPPGDKQ